MIKLTQSDLDSVNTFDDQMQLRNGTSALDIIEFFRDNPGAVQAVVEWVAEKYQVDQDCGTGDDVAPEGANDG